MDNSNSVFITSLSTGRNDLVFSGTKYVSKHTQRTRYEAARNLDGVGDAEELARVENVYERDVWIFSIS